MHGQNLCTSHRPSPRLLTSSAIDYHPGVHVVPNGHVIQIHSHQGGPQRKGNRVTGGLEPYAGSATCAIIGGARILVGAGWPGFHFRCRRILSTTMGSVMKLMICIWCPHSGHTSGSSSHSPTLSAGVNTDTYYTVCTRCQNAICFESWERVKSCQECGEINTLLIP